MLRFLRCTVLVASGLILSAAGIGSQPAAPGEASPSTSASETRPGEGAPLRYLDATVLGLVEGITEFLPVSSTGHLVLANEVLDLDREVQARDRNGQPLWAEPPDAATGSAGTPFTVKMAADVYTVAIQVGAIAAVTVLYWRALWSIVLGMLGRDRAGLRLLRNLLIAFFPAVLIGLALEDFIDRLFSVRAVAAALAVGAVVMFAADRWKRQSLARQGASAPDPQPSDLTVLQAASIGLMQCFALWPGMSRSMVTIVGGYVAGLRPARAAEFSFLLGLPTLAGAAAYKMMGSGGPVVAAFGTGPLLWGCLVAAVSAALAVRWLVFYLNRHGMTAFAIYRIVLAGLVLLVAR